MTAQGGPQSQRANTYGYARDTEEAGLQEQRRDLLRRGVPEQNVVSDQASLADPLPGLAQLMLTMRHGDRLHVTALDRIGRRSLDQRLLQLAQLGVEVYEAGELLPADVILMKAVPLPHHTSVLSERRHRRAGS